MKTIKQWVSWFFRYWRHRLKYGAYSAKILVKKPVHWIPFNINDTVRVKLLPRGVTLLNQYHRRLALDPAIYLKYHQPDAEGWVKYQMWEIMLYFGPGCEMGPQPPIETAIEIMVQPE